MLFSLVYSFFLRNLMLDYEKNSCFASDRVLLKILVFCFRGQEQWLPFYKQSTAKVIERAKQ
jgi:hypothetical protein